MALRKSNYCFTANNPNPDEAQLIHNLLARSVTPGESFIRYICFQYERGAEGNFHIQGYLQCIQRTGWKRVQSELGGRAHVEARVRSHREARDYCVDPEKRVAAEDGGLFNLGWLQGSDSMRSPGPYESGVPIITQGQRTDIAALHEALQEGVSLATISDEHFGLYVRYNRGIEKYVNLHNLPRNFDCVGELHVGVSGAGKSHYIQTNYPGAYWLPGGSGGWFDGYAGEAVIVLDDFDGSQLTYDLFKRLCDKYPLRLPVKGGFANCRASLIVISSNKPAHMWYAGQDPVPILRRISNTVSYTRPYTPPVDD